MPRAATSVATQNAGMPGGERVQCPLPLVLVAVAVGWLRAPTPARVSCFDEPVRAVAQCGRRMSVRPGRLAISAATATLSRADRTSTRCSAGPESVEDVTACSAALGGVAGHQLGRTLRSEGGGEEHPLARRLGVWSMICGDRGQETQVGHVIGLVEHGDWMPESV